MRLTPLHRWKLGWPLSCPQTRIELGVWSGEEVFISASLNSAQLQGKGDNDRRGGTGSPRGHSIALMGTEGLILGRQTAFGLPRCFLVHIY